MSLDILKNAMNIESVQDIEETPDSNELVESFLKRQGAKEPVEESLEEPIEEPIEESIEQPIEQPVVQEPVIQEATLFDDKINLSISRALNSVESDAEVFKVEPLIGTDDIGLTEDQSIVCMDNCNSLKIGGNGYIVMSINNKSYALSSNYKSKHLDRIVSEIETALENGKVYSTSLLNHMKEPILTAYDIAYIFKRFRGFRVTMNITKEYYSEDINSDIVGFIPTDYTIMIK